MINKETLNKITSSWTFLYIAIYGAMSFITITFTVIVNFLSNLEYHPLNASIQQIPGVITYSIIGLTGLISAISLLFIILL